VSRLDARSWTLRPGAVDPEHRREAWTRGTWGGATAMLWSGDYEGTKIVVGVRYLDGNGHAPLDGAEWYAVPATRSSPMRGPYPTRSSAAASCDLTRRR
jgi:hypothetical protein